MKLARIALLIAASIGAALCAACGANSTANTNNSNNSGGSGGAGGAGGSGGTPTCPSQSLISTAMGSSFAGPSADNFGTAACIYNGSGGNVVNVVFNSPNVSQSQFEAQEPAAIGTPAAALTGIGAAAFGSTAFGHAEVSVYESSSVGFAVTMDTPNSVITQQNLSQVEAVARAIAG